MSRLLSLDNEMHEWIERAIARLRKIYREVYLLADIERLTYAQISGIPQIGVSIVKSRLHRARLMMRKARACQAWD